MAVVAVPLALSASETMVVDGITQAARSTPNHTVEQRLAMAQARQASEHPMWRDLSPAQRLSRFGMLGNRWARAKIAAASGEQAAPELARFVGNLSFVQGPAGSTFALLRQTDCSLAMQYGTYTFSLTAPAITVQGTTAAFQNQLHAAGGLGTQAGAFARGCADPALGIGSRRGVFVGRIGANQLMFAASGYNFPAAQNALYYGTIDLSTQSVTRFETDLAVAELGALAVGDLDGDGLADIVGVDRFAGAIAVWRTLSDGRLAAPIRYAVPGNRTNALVIADFDGDGKNDVVVASAVDGGQETLSLLTGRGDGTLAAARSFNFSTPSGAFGNKVANLVAADLRGSGRPDVVGSTGVVMLNDGRGNFSQSAFAFESTQGTSSFGPNLAAGDFDEDGRIDIAVHNGSVVALHHGRGDGGFTPGRRYASNDSVGYVTATDLDGDGHLDLYVGLANGGVFGGDQFSVGQAYALMGAGDGSFRGAPVVPFVHTGSNLLDLDGDGVLDAVGVNADRSFTTFRGDGRGGFSAISTLSVATVSVAGEARPVGEIDSFVLADVNGDGRKDLIFRAKDFVARGSNGFYTGGLLLALAGADGRFGTPSFLAAPSFLGAGDIDIDPKQSHLLSADFNGDGKADLIYNYTVSSFDTSTYQVGTAVQLGNGDGSFQPAQTLLFHSGPQSTSFFREATVQKIADLNQDGKPDLVIAAMTGAFDATVGGNVAELQVALGRGDGSFAAPVAVTGPQHLARYVGQPDALPVVVADMDRDGLPDLVVLGGSDNYGVQVAVLPGRGDGSFKAPLLRSFAGQFLNNGLGLAVADFNGDGRLDVVVTDAFISSNNGVSFGNGDGTLQALGSDPAARHNRRIDILSGGVALAGDFNGDGLPDVLSGSTLLLGTADTPSAEPNSFVLAPSSTTGTVQAGQSVQTTLALTPGAGFSGTVSFSCAGLPAGAACSFVPPALTVGGAATSTVLTISTTAAAMASGAGLPQGPDPRLPAGVALALGALAVVRRPKGSARKGYGLLALLLLGSLALNGCGSDGEGGGAPAASTATPPGTYPVQVTASDGTLSRSITYTLVVN